LAAIPQTEALLNDVCRSWIPAPHLSLSEWADEYAYLSPESAHQPGQWHTLPYQRGIMDAFTDARVETITVKKSARVGYTKILNQIIGYCIHYDPKSVLVVQPTVEDAQGYSKDEIAPMLRDTSVLQGLVSEVKSRDSSNTILKKTYPGGSLMLVGANSPRGFRRISVPIVLFDEVNGYPVSAGTEGDQIKLGTKRSEWYWDRKIVLGSTPSIKGASKITTSFEASDQRYYHVPCPMCGEMQALEWGGRDHDYGIRWPKDRPEDAYYLCRGCHEKIRHTQKQGMIERGLWIPSAEFKGHAGFFIWAAYSYAPNAKWSDLVKDFLESKNDREKLKTHINTWRGEDFRVVVVSSTESRILKARCALPPQTVPQEAHALTCGIDNQKRGFWFVVRAWARDYTSWLIHYGPLATWDDVETLLFTTAYPVEGDPSTTLRIARAALDTGGGIGDEGDASMTEQAYFWLRKNCSGRGCKVWGVKGSSRPLAGKIRVGTPFDKTPSGKSLAGGIANIQSDPDRLKDMVYYRLNQAIEKADQAAYLHKDVGNDYAKQILAEEKRLVKNVYKWVQKGHQANHLLDAEGLCQVVAEPEWPTGGIHLLRPTRATVKKRAPQGPRVHRSKFAGR